MNFQLPRFALKLDDNDYDTEIGKLMSRRVSLCPVSLGRSSVTSYDGAPGIEYKDPFEFVTGSVYMGAWDPIGMANDGEYTFPHQVEYAGNMKDSTFTGEGLLKYPRGDMFQGEWENDKLLSYTYYFKDGLRYDDVDWKYCQWPDRRFQKSIEDGMRNACNELLTNDEEPREIPEGCYDVGEGFYDPKTKCIVSATDSMKVIRIPSNTEAKWIMQNCRKAWDEPVGFRPDLYEFWCSGRSGPNKFLSTSTVEEEEKPICNESSASLTKNLYDSPEAMGSKRSFQYHLLTL